MLIYTATNLINGKQYVGLTTKTLEQRVRGHMNDVIRHPDIKFYRAISKYGHDNFKFKVIEDDISDLSKLKEREVYWISELDTYYNGYNSTFGGDDSPMWHDSSCIKISIANKDKIVSATTRQKLREVHIGRKGTPHTEAHKKHMSEIMTGRVIGPKCRKNMSRAQMGKRQSKEHVEKRVKRIRGVAKTPEHRAKLAANLLENGFRASGAEHPRSISVHQMDKETGDIINSFDTIGDAEIKMGVKKGNGQISRCINGKRKTAFGYVWETQYWLPQHMGQ